jgi:hypothetical protein
MFIKSFSLLCILVPVVAFSQSNEVGALAGVTVSAASVSVPGVTINAGKTASVLVDFAVRLMERPTGNLYLELPAARILKASVGVNSDRVTAGAAQFFFTPGLRYELAPHARVSPYGVAGFGFGWFDSSDVYVSSSGGPLKVQILDGFKPAADVGAGAEVHITRRIGLRFEVRDFINCAAGIAGRNHVTFNGGLGFRF